jgi:hypothetical protein
LDSFGFEGYVRRMTDDVYEPISLGLQCETKYQLCRVRYEREAQPGDEPFSGEAAWGNPRFPTHIFDAQTTPFASMVTWLSSDFRGVFELADLHVEDGEPVNKRFGTRHPHEFPPLNGALCEADIVASYPKARARFDHLANKFRAHLRADGAFLYVLREFRPRAEIEALLALLGEDLSRRRIHLLMLDWEDLNADAEGLPNTTVARLPRHIPKPPSDAWSGNDAGWSRALAPFQFMPTR